MSTQDQQFVTIQVTVPIPRAVQNDHMSTQGFIAKATRVVQDGLRTVVDVDDRNKLVVRATSNPATAHSVSGRSEMAAAKEKANSQQEEEVVDLHQKNKDRVEPDEDLFDDEFLGLFGDLPRDGIVGHEEHKDLSKVAENALFLGSVVDGDQKNHPNEDAGDDDYFAEVCSFAGDDLLGDYPVGPGDHVAREDRHVETKDSAVFNKRKREDIVGVDGDGVKVEEDERPAQRAREFEAWDPELEQYLFGGDMFGGDNDMDFC